MTRSQKFMYNTISSAIYQVIVMAVGFITPRVMLITYGSEINGLVSSITQFISYFNLVEAGLSGAAIYALYKPLADNDHKAINGVVSAAKKFYYISGYIFVLLVIGLACLYPILVKTEYLSPLFVGTLVLIMGVSGTLEFFTLAKYRAIISADQKSYVISFASIIHMILNTIIVVSLAKLKVNIVLLELIALLSIFLRSLILMIYTHRKYSYIDYKAEPNEKALDKRWDALYLQVLNVVQKGAPTVLATIFTNLKSVSVYSIFNMVVSGISSLLDIFMSGLSASFGDIIARKDIKTLQKAYREFEFTYYALITVVYTTALVMIMSFVKIYTNGITDVSYNQPLIGFLFVINGFLYNIKTPQGMLVISAGLYKETKVQSTIQAVIVIISGVILTPFTGLAGVLIALCLSNVYRDIDLILFIPKHVTHLPVKETIFRLIHTFIAIGLIIIPFIFININIQNIVQWCLYAFVVFTYSVVVICIIYFIFDKQQFKSVLLRIKRLII